MSTDDFGHYRITGLAPGEYATQANLSISDHNSSYGPMPGHSEVNIEVQLKVRYSLPLFSGDLIRQRDATGYMLGSVEAHAGSDLVFPLAKGSSQ